MSGRALLLDARAEAMFPAPIYFQQMAKLACLLLLPVPWAAAQTVEGTVLDAATGAGIAGVKVELLKGGTPFYETATDGAGTFHFFDVKEGDYAARYQSPEYWLTAGPSDYRYFHVAGEKPIKLNARLMPWSKISGRVVDPAGRPVPNARLDITGMGMVMNGRTYLRTSWGGGGGGQLSDSPLSMSHAGTADAHGNFEIGVMPGAYILSVRPPPEFKPPAPEPDGPALAWEHTYYPGVSSPAEASKIVALPGSVVSGVEVKLRTVPVRSLRGVVLNPDGTPAPNAAITVGIETLLPSLTSRADGTFESPSVPEGECRLVAEAQVGGVKLRAVEWIEVKGHDLEDVKLRLLPPLTVRGKVIMEAPKDGPAPGMNPLILSLLGGRGRRDGDFGFVAAMLINPDPKGDFIAAGSYPGEYRVAPILQSPPPPYYLDSIRVGDADLATQDVAIAFDTTITVLYKTDGGQVSGKAENCASGGVVLVPANPALRRHGFSKAGACDAGDRYEVRAVRPGDYYALAFAGNGPALAADEAMLQQAVKLTVRAGESTVADVKAITHPIY